MAPPSNRNAGSAWNLGWVPDPASETWLAHLAPGQELTVAKWGPDGEEVTRYPATVIDSAAASPWIEVEARWTIRDVDVSGLLFATGDSLREFFSPIHPYNAFAVYAPDGTLRGWYGNVTYPAFVVWEGESPVLVWRDLYLDAVVLANGETVMLDDDDLEASGIPAADPGFAEAIIAASDELLLTMRAFPVKG